jgi:hypothetical protein
MRLILSLIFIAMIVVGAHIYLTRQDEVRQLATCYSLQKAAVTEEGYVTRRTYMNEATICEQRKAAIMEAYRCFAEASDGVNASSWETSLLKSFAKYTNQVSREIDEVIADHNRRCLDHGGLITEVELEKASSMY